MTRTGRGGRYHGPRSQRSIAGLVVGFTAVLVATGVNAQNQPLKPKLPPGRDPGGVVIGLMTTGIDPTRPEVARCLARDGEGEVLGWDMVDRIREPFRHAQPGQLGDEIHFANLICSRRLRIAPVRIDPADGTTHGKAMAFFSTTPARIVVVPAANAPSDLSHLRRAAEAFPQLLLLVEAEPKPTVLEGVLNIVAAVPGTAMAQAARVALP